MAKTKNEVKLLEKLKSLNGKFKCCHKGICDGRKQIYVLIKIDNKYYIGLADCSNKDTFSKKIGRAVAFGRAMKNFEEGKVTHPLEELKFTEDKEVKND